MKRSLHIVAALVMGFLALQPILGELPCVSVADSSCAANCPMAKAGADCPMAQSFAAEGCPPDCCTHPRPQMTVQAATLAKPKMVVAGFGTALLIRADEPRQASRVEPNAKPAVSPPLYKRLRVFRI